jgi:hypothetical protein
MTNKLDPNLPIFMDNCIIVPTTYISGGVDAISSNINHILENSRMQFVTAANKRKKIIVVDNIATFFSRKNFKNILDNILTVEYADLKLEAIAKYNDYSISFEEIQLIKNTRLIEKNIISGVFNKDKTVNIDGYEFAPVPEDWILSENIEITDKSIKRVGFPYMIGHKSLLQVWVKARDYWKTGSGKDYFSVRASGQYRNTYLFKDSIKIGCQTVKRFELEQVAVELGFPFN